MNEKESLAEAMSEYIKRRRSGGSGNLVSSCCGATPKNYNNDCDSSDFGICPECGEHCEYEEQE